MWVRTRVPGTVEHALRAGSIAWGPKAGTLILEFDNGEYDINGVTVKAGRYPVFTPGCRYLGLLAYDSVHKSWTLGRGFRIDADNKLARLSNWDGTINWFSGPLEGVPLTTVIDRLTKK